MSFENKYEKVIPKKEFYGRAIRYSLIASLMIGVAWFIGAWGYWYLGGLPWIDAFYNAAMILGGMGPVDLLKSNAAKLFASFYALFSGITFLSATSVLFAPFVHRFFHLLHVDDTNSD